MRLANLVQTPDVSPRDDPAQIAVVRGLGGHVGWSLCAVHAGVVRRFALVRIQDFLRSTQGVVLEASDLDYNLLQSHYELKDIVLKSKGLADLPAPVRAKRVTVTVSLWDLIRGSFNGAPI